ESDLAVLETLEKETSELQEERTKIERKMQIATKTDIKPIVIENHRSVDKEKLETRGKSLKESRIIQVSSEEILLPEHTSDKLAPYPFLQVSTLVDRVNVIN
ncbi:hypothetical protein RZS08_62060, partial [Arthrospira platensis SPKY1]|nr:hypothetical protein [Arthrospira platensis SPKY1]